MLTGPTKAKKALQSWNQNRASLIAMFLAFGFLQLGPAIAADANHLKLLERTGNCINCDLSAANLSGKKFVDGDLSGANFEGANLSGTDFSKSYLSNANLKRANLSKSNLTNTYLYGSDLTGADLRGATTTDANFVSATLVNTKIENARGVFNAHFSKISNVDVLEKPGMFKIFVNYERQAGGVLSKSEMVNPICLSEDPYFLMHGFEKCRIPSTGVWK